MITVLDVAIQSGAKKLADGSITASEFYRLGLPFFSGCQCCAASLGPYNAYPSKTGYIQCKECIGDLGFESVNAFRSWETSLQNRYSVDEIEELISVGEGE